MAPDISVTKTADPTSVPETGGDVTFTFVVTNDGVEDVTLTSLTDSIFGDLNGQGNCVTGGLIAVGGSYSCSITKTLSADDLTDHYNVTTAVGTDDDGTADTATDDETVTFTDVAPDISVTKTADPTVVTTDTAEVTFTFLVTNNSLESGTILSLVDSVFGTLTGDADCQVGTVLAGGASCTFEYTTVISGEANSTHSNVFTAVVGDDDQNQDSAEDDESVFFDFNSNLYISKTNNAWPNDQRVGDEVTYTIKLVALNGPVYDITMTDLFPDQFEYVSGSFTANSSAGDDLKAEGTVPQPVYSSPGKWQIGDMEKDEIVTLTYRAKINEDADDGVYPDLAWARGTSARAQASEEGGADLTAISDPNLDLNSGESQFDGEQGHLGETTFVGTQVAVVSSAQSPVDYQVEQTVEKTGEVLGASTLPATGARTWLLFLAALSVIGGLGLVLVGRKKMLKSALSLLILVFGLGLVKPAQAATQIRIEEPYNSSSEFGQVGATNQGDVRVDFVILDQDGQTPTAQCQSKKDADAWQDLTTVYSAKVGGNSGYCQAEDLSDLSSYQFRVVATVGTSQITSRTVELELQQQKPGTPTNYHKTVGDNCVDLIMFKTADDDRTVKVEVYRSENADKFTAGPGSLAESISASPDQEYTVDTSRPDCQKDYYYAVRAFDQYGNGSGLIGDREVKEVIVEGGESITVTQPGTATSGSTPGTGAIPVTDSLIGVDDAETGLTADGATDETADGNAQDQESLAGNGEGVAEGEVLGAENMSLVEWLRRYGLPIALVGIGGAVIYVLLFAKKH